MKARPLFGGSPLFGVSVKREFTVYDLKEKGVIHILHPSMLGRN